MAIFGKTSVSRLTVLVGLILCALLHGTVAMGQTDTGFKKIPGVPDRTDGVGIDQKLGGSVSLDLPFRDQNGDTCLLRNFINGKRPVLLTLNYSNCPGLCVAQLDGLAQSLRGFDAFALGQDFEMISVSIDPAETTAEAMGTFKKYTKGLEAPHQAKGWHFLTGTTDSIFKIADEVGFRYTYDEQNKRFNHAAMAVVISPQGKITRYFFDVGFEPKTMRLALLEASEGKIGTAIDALILWCMHYDESENRYSADARKLLAIGAAIFVMAVVGFSAPFWFGKNRNSGSNRDGLSGATNDGTLKPDEQELSQAVMPTSESVDESVCH